MKRNGEEKEVQALFYELKVADESHAPEFVTTWQRAATPRYKTPRVLKPSFVLTSALIMTAVCSVVIWQRYQQSSDWDTGKSTGIAVISPTMIPGSTPMLVDPPEVRKPIKVRHRISSRRHTAPIKLRTAEMRMAVAVSTWQSPTATLMESPSEELLLLPQFDQSVTELRMFLPNE